MTHAADGGAPGRRRAAVVFAPVVVALSVLACSGSGSTDDRPPGVVEPGTTGGSGGSGGSGSGGRASGGTGGTGDAGEGSGGSAAAGGRAGGATGGTGQASGGLGNEAGTGDGNEAGGPTVPLEPERCSDGFDNDGDGNADCADDECEPACAAVCGSVESVLDPSTQSSSNVGHAATPASHCGAPAEGPAVVYSVTAENTGVLEASVMGSGLLRVAIRSACDDAGALGCGLSRATAPVSAGEELFVVVQGIEATDAGGFTLSVMSRELDVCGDGFRDGAEGCDDENAESGDGCDPECEVESDETENNDTLAAADTYADPFFAEIDPEDDVDSVGFDLATRASVIVSTENVGEGSCTFGLLDSFLELLDENGDSLAVDDDGGEGLCARIVLPNLPVGHYTARVSASPAGDTPTFPYRLLIVTDICGNGRTTVAEECDDGNVVNGDGCSSTCRAE
jgi:cysteine-rich repeat protein